MPRPSRCGALGTNAAASCVARAESARKRGARLSGYVVQFDTRPGYSRGTAVKNRDGAILYPTSASGAAGVRWTRIPWLT